MTEATSSPAPRWLAWMPALALLVTIIGANLAFGGYLSTQVDQGRRIEAMEKREIEERDRRSEQMTDIRERTIRIEARLDALVPANRGDGR
ncbi:hypothetical protein [uncultured Sphingomonas sp.]|uniref:hypothetical protein n=1 Tax=uncultured Sphingomonas sp. TaxID=158754 RepID=UPI0025FF8A0B|nr:hypothetical protein [uncultured Sphingomonas sp.]